MYDANYKTNIGARIRKLREDSDLTLLELGKIVGLSDVSILRYENGKVKNISLDFLIKISNFFGVNIAYIMGLENETDTKNNNAPMTLNYDYIPYGVSCGCLDHIEPLTELSKIEVPTIALGKYAYNKDLIFMHANGESMNNVIKNGALIAVKRDTPIESLNNGDIVVISTDEGYSVKRYYYNEENNRLVFSPDSSNPTFFPFSRSMDELTVIVGKVVMYNVIL